MSLKGFHIFFIVLSILLTAGFGVWSFVNGVGPAFGIGACVTTGGLIAYGIYFVRKSRRIIV